MELKQRITRLKDQTFRKMFALELRWRARLAAAALRWNREVEKERKRADSEADKAAETIRRVSRISYHMERQFGTFAVTVQIPLLELSYSRGPTDIHFEHVAEQVSWMMRREMKQLNMATLAQSIRAAEERQRMIEEADRYYRPRFGVA